MAEMKIINNQNVIDLSQESLFELQCLIKANDIEHIAISEVHQYQYKSQFFAFTSGSSDLGLYYLRDTSSLPIIKRIPWFQSSRKKIACLCFDPLGFWLLVASIDGSLYILPAKTLVDEFYPADQKWTTKDITSFPSLNVRNSYSRPSAIVWWQGSSFDAQIAVIGTEQGEIIFVNLESGQQVGSTKIDGHIINLSICQTTELGPVTLLITNHIKKQWVLFLEKPEDSYTFPLNNGESQRSARYNEEADNDDSKTFPTARSRLRGLKQLSVEKLVILKRKIATSRNRNLESTDMHSESSNPENVCESGANDNENANEINFPSSNQQPESNCSATPTALSNDTYFTVHSLENRRHIYSCYQSSKNCLTIHDRSFSSTPSLFYRIPENYDSILLTNTFFYISDTKRRVVYVVSRPLSEIGKFESNLSKESIIARFPFDKSIEVINSIHRVSSTRSDEYTSLNDSKPYCTVKHKNDLKLYIPPVDTCIVVTNLGVYKIIVRKHIITLFMDLILKRRAFNAVWKLGLIFGLDVRKLLECAGDIMLNNMQYSRTMELYSLAECHLLKNIVKFASVGYSAGLIHILTACSETSALSELSEQDKYNLSNLSVLAYTELALRRMPSQSKIIYRKFLNFLSSNNLRDEMFAINIALQTNMWNILHHLIVQRGLGPQVLDVVVKILPTFMVNATPHNNIHGLLMCLSESSLIQGLLNNPGIARTHTCFILANLPSLQIFILQRLLALYDPTSAAIRQLLLRFKARRKAASRSSFSSQCDSLDLSEDLDKIGVLVEEIIEVFLQTLLTFLHKKQQCVKFIPKYISLTSLPGIEGNHVEKNLIVDFNRRQLCSGFAHTALIRNGRIYTWGNTLQGCLGTGPMVPQYSLATDIFMFRRLGIEVLSVSCGYCHTLAVTNNGVYAWGGNRLGQLGLGDMIQCPNPEMITSLSQEMIVEAVAGQYHSVALTADGRVFTWGWGVYGQLGLGNTENARLPQFVMSLLGVVARHASAGYAHTLILSHDGYVYSFGCNLFGQVGNGVGSKSLLPVKISLLPERITSISTKYFHNLAISCTNKLYTWGANPQVLRLQSRERKVRLHKLRKLAATGAQENHDNSVNKAESSEQSENVQSQGEAKSREDIRISKSALAEAEGLDNNAHFTPTLVDTDMVKGKILQISTGYHHSALLTKYNNIYTWGRNFEGQLGNGCSGDVPVPTLLFRPMMDKYCTSKINVNDDRSNANAGLNSDADVDPFENQKQQWNRSYELKAVKVCCGSNFTVAIRPDGSILAWGSNSTAQLGRDPENSREAEEKGIFRSKILRYVNRDHSRLLDYSLPTQVPNIPAPAVSFLCYDVTPLAGSIRPLIYVEPNFGDLTLHYALEQFHGLFSTYKILNKCAELKNYQACAKLEFLERNLVEALIYQFKALKELDPTNLEPLSIGSSIESLVCDNREDDILQENSILFEKQVEKNLVDTLIETVKRQKLKMPTSKSLDSFQIIDQELRDFDCQGGSEELFEDSKCEVMAFEASLDDNNDDKDDRDSPISSMENICVDYTASFRKTIKNNVLKDMNTENSACTDYKRNLNKLPVAKQECANIDAQTQELLLQYAVNIVCFYLYEVEEDAHVTMYEIAAISINFWAENNLPIEELEKVFYKYMHKMFYSLGLLFFSQYNSQNNTENEERERNIHVKNVEKILTTGFCLKVCSLVSEYIEKGKPAAEYIELLSTSVAKNYGPPLTGYPGSTDNKTPEQMIDGIISTLSANYCDPMPFIHIKDPDKVSELLNAEEDSMIFTCGHQFLISTYQSEAIPRMEAELLACGMPLLSTILSSMLSQSYKTETVCPTCLLQILRDVSKDAMDK